MFVLPCNSTPSHLAQRQTASSYSPGLAPCPFDCLSLSDSFCLLLECRCLLSIYTLLQLFCSCHCLINHPPIRYFKAHSYLMSNCEDKYYVYLVRG